MNILPGLGASHISEAFFRLGKMTGAGMDEMLLHLLMRDAALTALEMFGAHRPMRVTGRTNAQSGTVSI